MDGVIVTMNSNVPSSPELDFVVVFIAFLKNVHGEIAC